MLARVLDADGNPDNKFVMRLRPSFRRHQKENTGRAG